MQANENYIEQLIGLRVYQQMDDWGEHFQDGDKLAAKTRTYLLEHLNKDLYMFVEEHNGGVIATCGLSVIKLLPQCNDNGKYGYVCNVYTMPSYRRKGIATKLLNECIEFARKNGLSELNLDSDSPNAVLMYEKAGFKQNNMNMALPL